MNNGNYVLGQGLATSSLIAFLCYEDLFTYLYNECKKHGIEMSIYVDDIAFSSSKKIDQKFIDKIFGLFKRNGLIINKLKVHYSGKYTKKKITGLFVSPKGLHMKSSKYEELHVIYNKLKLDLLKIKDFKSYLYYYDLYLRFFGNFQQLKMVEEVNMSEKVFNNKYGQYIKLIENFKHFFPIGIKKNSNASYVDTKMSKEDEEKLKKHFNLLLEYSKNKII